MPALNIAFDVTPGRSRDRDRDRGGRARAALRGGDRPCPCALRSWPRRARCTGSGSVAGSAGNVSAREGDRIHITPAGLPYDATTEADLVTLDLEGAVVAGEREPSSERRVHLAVYAARPDAGALVHTHSTHATAWSFLGEPLDTSTEELEHAAGGAVRPRPMRRRVGRDRRRRRVGPRRPRGRAARPARSARAGRLAGSGARHRGVVERQAHLAWLLRGVTRSSGLMPACRASVASAAAVGASSSSASAVVARRRASGSPGSRISPAPGSRRALLTHSTKAGSCSQVVVAAGVARIEAHEHEGVGEGAIAGPAQAAQREQPDHQLHEHDQAVALVATRRKQRSAGQVVGRARGRASFAVEDPALGHRLAGARAPGRRGPPRPR